MWNAVIIIILKVLSNNLILCRSSLLRIEILFSAIGFIYCFSYLVIFEWMPTLSIIFDLDIFGPRNVLELNIFKKYKLFILPIQRAYRQIGGEKKNLYTAGGKANQVQPLWRTVCETLKKPELELIYDPVTQYGYTLRKPELFRCDSS